MSDYVVDEVIDTVKYFRDHADEYNIDTERIVIFGYSSGDYHTMALVLELEKQGVDISAQAICYGFNKEVVETYNAMTDQRKKGVAPALFILANNDPLSDGSLKYEEFPRDNGVQTEVKKYDGSIRGFIEENNPEYENLHSAQSKASELQKIAGEAEDYIRLGLNGVRREE